MIIKTNKQLSDLTGSWYESNNFDKIRQDIELETEDLAKIIGDDIIDNGIAILDKSDPSPAELKLLQRIQLPIALMATYRYYQSNIVSHDQSTRKIKIDSENEKLPWEWMLDRDDDAHLSKAQRAVDRLIKYLEDSDNSDWKNSDYKKASKSLFVNNTDVFGEYYPIDNSARFYYLATPLLREVQTNELKDALGSDYIKLLEDFQAGQLTEYQNELLDHTRRAQTLLTISLAVKRLNIKVLPEGVVKAVKSERSTVNASRPADVNEIAYFSKRLTADAERYLDKIKRLRYRNSSEYLDYQLIPKNDPKNKFART
ncbi:DUF6712 family protein [Sphingobacterium spiritivorum]|uniref:DUF6712 family protein n=1 Tax=Sphingobacterium spiritivorum TaxID=258 RepID=UPI003DA43A7E